MNFFKNKLVLVTGGAGFIGSHLVEALVGFGAKVTVPTLSLKPTPFLSAVKDKINLVTADLKNPAAAQKVVKGQDLIFHLAAHVGGVHYNQINPATLLYENSLPAINVFAAAKSHPPQRLLYVSSACVYPRECSFPTQESEGFLNEPEITNYGYGWGKRIGELFAKTYAQEFKLKVGIVRPYNAYGPRDNFDPKSSHVIPALVKRVIDGENPLVVWGDGSATRSFIYIDDIVRGMLLAIEKYPRPDPINLGTKEEISVRDLARLIVKLAGTETKIVFDQAKPSGQPRRNCAAGKAQKLLGFKAETTLNQGLPQVIDYYKKTHG
ncbi:TPA: GDP-fucose synthetase [Candidatus Beckwithbacteria bacterium]|nr:GDP-fucose synthetase [Candidatus Beckwithbacteria bacterium]